MGNIKDARIEVNEIFTSIQGEGKYTGYPSTFIRLVGCNLRCVFSTSICDSAYTSHRPEPANFLNIGEVITEVKRQHEEYNNNIGHIVITGGEPMRQQHALKILIPELKKALNRELVVTIESNGTYMNTQLTSGEVDLWSLSPKLSTSENFDTEYAKEVISEVDMNTHRKMRIK